MMNDQIAVLAVNEAVNVIMFRDTSASLADALTRLIAQASLDLEGIDGDLEHWTR